MVHNDTKDGKRVIIICTNRIERAAHDAAQVAINAKDIERKAYRSALDSLRRTRAGMAGKDQAEAAKAIDEAIAELEADMAKAN